MVVGEEKVGVVRRMKMRMKRRRRGREEGVGVMMAIIYRRVT